MSLIANYSRRFTLDNLDIRGQVVQLSGVWQAMHADRGYQPAVRQFLGELSCVTVMIGAGLKHAGRASLQIQPARDERGAKPPLAVLDCTDTLGLRGMARQSLNATQSFADWVSGGTLSMTVTNTATDHIYQSIVPVSGISVADCFEHYFDLSEQLPTHLWLAANEFGAGALLLQKLPDADIKDTDGWARVGQLAASVSDSELIELPADQLLTRLFAEDSVRIYEKKTVHHGCQRDSSKVEAVLRSLGRDELLATLAEQGVITVTDEICNQVYQFDADAVNRLLAQ